MINPPGSADLGGYSYRGSSSVEMQMQSVSEIGYTTFDIMAEGFKNTDMVTRGQVFDQKLGRKISRSCGGDGKMAGRVGQIRLELRLKFRG